MKTFRIWFTNPMIEGERYKEVQSKSIEVVSKRAAKEVIFSYSIWPDGRKMTFAEHLKLSLPEAKALGIKVAYSPSTVLRIEEI